NFGLTRRSRPNQSRAPPLVWQTPCYDGAAVGGEPAGTAAICKKEHSVQGVRRVRKPAALGSRGYRHERLGPSALPERRSRLWAARGSRWDAASRYQLALPRQPRRRRRGAKIGRPAWNDRRAVWG